MADLNISGAKKAGGSGCLILFGAIFVIAGMVPGALALHSLFQWMQADHWAQVPARILEARLTRGDDTYSVEARYEYRYAGRDYESTRVSFHSGSDNIGDFHQSTYSLLKRHQESGEPIAIYVDPSAPDNAVIVRNMRWELFGFMMIFPLVFGSAGGGIIAMAVYGGKRAKAETKRRALYPDEPWRWRPEWENGVVQADTRKTLWFAVFFAGIWNLISLPLPFMLWGEVTNKDNYAALLGLLFPVVGIGLAVWVARLILRLRRFGTMTFTLDTFPGALGGQLAGKFYSPTALPVDSELDVRLTCVRKRTSGSGKNRSTHESFLWQDEQRLRVQAHHVFEGTRIHIAFPLPSDKPGSDDGDPDDQILWRLALSADVPGVDMDASFEVPVYDIGHTTSPLQRVAEVTSTAAEEPDWQRTGVVARRVVEGWELYFPPARHKTMAFAVTLFATIFGGVAVFLLFEDETFMAIVFGAFALLIGWGALYLLLMRSRVVAGTGSLNVQRGYLFLGNARTWSSPEIETVAVETGTRAGNTQYYDLIARTRNDGKIKLAHTLPGRRDAEALADFIAENLGIRR